MRLIGCCRIAILFINLNWKSICPVIYILLKNDFYKLDELNNITKNDTLMKLTGHGFKRSFSLVFGSGFMSDQFIELINVKLANDFYRQLKEPKQTSEIYLGFAQGDFSYSTKRGVQKLTLRISVRNMSFRATILWKNKSKYGTMIRPHFTEINEDDIEMWFEDLPMDKISKEYKQSPPNYGIQVNHLSYPVEIAHFEVGLYVLCYLNDDDIQTGEQIGQQLNDFVNTWNKKSDYKGGKYGVIHNGNVEKIEAGFVQYYFDWGSASKTAMDQLLTLLDKTKKIERLKITSYP